MQVKVTYPIMGTKFRPEADREALRSAAALCEAHCVPEPDNKYDPYAIKVLVRVSAPASEREEELLDAPREAHWAFVGYIPKGRAIVVSALIEEGKLTSANIPQGENVELVFDLDESEAASVERDLFGQPGLSYEGLKTKPNDFGDSSQ